MKITLLGGGIGCSRLALPLARRLGSSLTVVVNTGDDLWRYGLRVCPDLDTNMYALAGMQDRARGWGVAGDTFRAMGQLKVLGDDPWFNLGDLDLAMHLRRSAALHDGKSLTAFTAEVAEALGVAATVLPMTDSEVETRITTPGGEHSFEEYFVRDAANESIDAVAYRGIGSAAPTKEVLDAIGGADLVVIGPSNPVSSIGPILALPGVREAVRARPCVAVTPVVSGLEIIDEGESRRARSREMQLRSVGLAHDASSVASLYREIADAFVFDSADEDQAEPIASLGLIALAAPTIIVEQQAADDLAATVCALGLSAPSVQPIDEPNRA